jgi:Flp pilus assembly protein TadG
MINIKKRNPKLADRKGQALIETALAVPIILLLIFSFIDLGRAIYYYSALQNSVREGARYASVHKLETTDDTDLVKDKVVAYSVAVDITTSDVTVTPETYVSGTTTEVTVSASYGFEPITPFLAWAFDPSSPSAIVMNAETTMLLAPIAK